MFLYWENFTRLRIQNFIGCDTKKISNHNINGKKMFDVNSQTIKY